ncbi:zinc finger domain-containing protein [Haloechinothrix aidingensis]|uniref:zinc finger domain-containing protein n=1 Tax=Haloechinothrix aidingensis TaxID=2752311 RepID=UPI003CCD27ED
MTRRRRYSDGPGLWRWTPTGIEPETNRPNPRRRPCPTCGAGVGHPCSRPSRRGGRRPIAGYHDARYDQERSDQ